MVDLLGLDAVAVGHELHEGGAAAVAGRGEDEISLDDRRGNLGRSAGSPVVVPQELAVGGIDAHESLFLASRERDVLPDAADLGDHDG